MASITIRGLDEEDLKSAKFDAAELTLAESYAASRAEAQNFANQGKLDVPDLKEHAKTLGLDTTKFEACLDGSKMKAKVDGDTAAGAKVGVNGTPAFFINGVMLSGAQPFSEFEKIINQELK